MLHLPLAHYMLTVTLVVTFTRELPLSRNALHMLRLLTKLRSGNVIVFAPRPVAAGALSTLPEGDWLGYVQPASVPAVVDAALAGRPLPPLLRGIMGVRDDALAAMLPQFGKDGAKNAGDKGKGGKGKHDKSKDKTGNADNAGNANANDAAAAKESKLPARGSGKAAANAAQVDLEAVPAPSTSGKSAAAKTASASAAASCETGSAACDNGACDCAQ